MATRYFLFSSEQLRFRRGIEEKMGRKFHVGTVVYNGERKPFTEISSSPTSRYADAKVVAKGDPSLMVYTPPSGEK